MIASTLPSTGRDAMPPPILRHVGQVEPKHDSGCFDHAAVHAQTGHVFVGHTVKKTRDVLDPTLGRHLFSARCARRALRSAITKFGRILGSFRSKNLQPRMELDEFNDHLLADIGLHREPAERAVEREVRILMLRLPRC